MISDTDIFRIYSRHLCIVKIAKPVKTRRVTSRVGLYWVFVPKQFFILRTIHLYCLVLQVTFNSFSNTCTNIRVACIWSEHVVAFIKCCVYRTGLPAVYIIKKMWSSHTVYLCLCHAMTYVVTTYSICREWPAWSFLCMTKEWEKRQCTNHILMGSTFLSAMYGCDKIWTEQMI